MTVVRPEDLRFDDLPDAAVLTELQTSAITTLSRDTLKRLHSQGVLPRTQISQGRIGYTAGNIRAHLKNKTGTVA